MLFTWSKLPTAVICPVCGAKVPVRRDRNSQLQPKPYCDTCGWNVGPAGKQLFTQLGSVVAIATLFILYAWAWTGIKGIALFAGGWGLLFMGFPILGRLRRLPRSRPMLPLKPLSSGIADFRTVTFDAMRPRLNIALEGLIVTISAVAIIFLSRELVPDRRLLPKPAHERLFVVLLMGFAAYEFGSHALAFFRLLRSIRLERHLANGAMVAGGRILDSNSGRIRYEFLDHSNRLMRGVGRDYTMGLYEDMSLSVLYDPNNSSLNMPEAGLQFHRPREANQHEPTVLQ